MARSLAQRAFDAARIPQQAAYTHPSPQRQIYCASQLAAPPCCAVVRAQAVMNGALFATVRMTRAAYLTFAWGMLPFFCFNAYFTLIDPLVNSFMWLDAAGSAAIVAACVWGLRRLGAPAAAAAKRHRRQ